MRLNSLKIFIGLTFISLSSLAQLVIKEKPLLKEIDSVSYAIGMNTGLRMKTDPMAKDLDVDLYILGYLNSIKSTNLLLDTKASENIIRKYFQKKQAEIRNQQEEEGKKKSETEYADFKKKNEQFLLENKSKKGVITTVSGLQYQILREGIGESPKATDKVKVHYHGTVIDGTVFDSSVERKQPAEFGVSQVIKGWVEGLQLMKIGAKYKFFIPQELAYGFQGRMPKIKPFSMLIFEVELIEIK